MYSKKKNYCNNQLEIARDTIKTQSQLITNLDTIIKNQSLVVVLLKDNIKKYEKVIENKDTEIKVYQDLYKKEKKTKKLVIGGGSVLLLLSIIFLWYLLGMNPTSKAFEDAKKSILSNVTSSEDRLSVMKIPIEGETKEVTATGGSSGPYTPKLSLFSDEAPKTQSKGGEVKETEKIKGGIADNKTIKDIAKKHDKKGYYDIDNMISSLKKTT